MGIRQPFFTNLQSTGIVSDATPPTGYRITHRFHHDADKEEGIPAEQTIDTIDVDSWEDISDTIERLLLHTGNGFTISMHIEGLGA